MNKPLWRRSVDLRLEFALFHTAVNRGIRTCKPGSRAYEVTWEEIDEFYIRIGFNTLPDKEMLRRLSSYKKHGFDGYVNGQMYTEYSTHQAHHEILMTTALVGR